MKAKIQKNKAKLTKNLKRRQSKDDLRRKKILIDKEDALTRERHKSLIIDVLNKDLKTRGQLLSRHHSICEKTARIQCNHCGETMTKRIDTYGNYHHKCWKRPKDKKKGDESLKELIALSTKKKDTKCKFKHDGTCLMELSQSQDPAIAAIQQLTKGAMVRSSSDLVASAGQSMQPQTTEFYHDMINEEMEMTPRRHGSKKTWPNNSTDFQFLQHLQGSMREWSADEKSESSKFGIGIDVIPMRTRSNKCLSPNSGRGGMSGTNLFEPPSKVPSGSRREVSFAGSLSMVTTRSSSRRLKDLEEDIQIRRTSFDLHPLSPLHRRSSTDIAGNRERRSSVEEIPLRGNQCTTLDDPEVLEKLTTDLKTFGSFVYDAEGQKLILTLKQVYQCCLPQVFSALYFN